MEIRDRYNTSGFEVEKSALVVDESIQQLF